MHRNTFRIGVVAPGSRIDSVIADGVAEVAAGLYPDRKPEIVYHPQCFLTSGHFAGDDATRTAAFLDIANDERFDALWFARGGYGACRIAEDVMAGLTDRARRKLYLGYSDAGSLLAGLYTLGFEGVAHGPMPSDILRAGGQAAVARALEYLVDRSEDSLEPSVSGDTNTAAFNITILGHLLGTPLQPDLTGHVLMLEEVSEHMYRIDRALFHLTGNPGIKRVAGIMLGRCTEIPLNDPDFAQTEEDVARHWCERSGIPYLGRADIGHDVHNKIVPFGRLPPG